MFTKTHWVMMFIASTNILNGVFQYTHNRAVGVALVASAAASLVSASALACELVRERRAQ